MNVVAGKETLIGELQNYIIMLGLGTVTNKFNKLIPNCCGSSLWSSGQSSWLQIQRPRFISRRYEIF
jgi:hypothetical protein